MHNYFNSLIITLLSLFFIGGIYSDTSAQSNTRSTNLLELDYKPYHFGFLLGLNQMDFDLKPIEDFDELSMEKGFSELNQVLSQPEYGFNIGIVSNLKLLPRLDLKFIPTLTFGDRTVIYKGYQNESPYRRTQTIESTFLDFPLLLKYKSVRINKNSRVYLIGGAKYTYDLASLEDIDEEDILVKISKNDYFYEFGVGFDHYFFYFKFSAEIKASFGMRDILQDEGTIFSNSIKSLNSNIIQISLLFEG